MRYLLYILLCTPFVNTNLRVPTSYDYSKMDVLNEREVTDYTHYTNDYTVPSIDTVPSINIHNTVIIEK